MLAHRATRLPLEDPGQRRMGGFWKCRHTPSEVQPTRRSTVTATPPGRSRIPRDAKGAGGNGDGRIRTDDPLLAKQVLSH